MILNRSLYVQQPYVRYGWTDSEFERGDRNGADSRLAFPRLMYLRRTETVL